MPLYERSARAASGANDPRPLDSPPANFDPAALPLIARHFYGIAPLRSIGKVAAEVVADLRFRRQVQQLHDLGPRIVAELLAEIAAERGIATIVNQKLDTYVDLDPTAIEAAGGDGFWTVPFREARNDE